MTSKRTAGLQMLMRNNLLRACMPHCPVHAYSSYIHTLCKTFANEPDTWLRFRVEMQGEKNDLSMGLCFEH